MLTPDRIREHLRICLPTLTRFTDDRQTIAELGLDSIDLVDLFCFIHSEFDVDPAALSIGLQTTIHDLMLFIAENAKTPVVDSLPVPVAQSETHLRK